MTGNEEGDESGGMEAEQPEKPGARNLIYTVAFDPPTKPFHQVMAKMLVSSIFRTGFTGDVVVLTNSEHRVFEHGRERLEEVSLDTARVDGGLGDAAQRFKFEAREFFDPSGYEWVMFVDCDCLFMENPERLLAGTTGAEILYAEEPFCDLSHDAFNAYLTDAEIAGARESKRMGINSGTLAVKGAAFAGVMKEWERVYRGPCRHRGWHDQTAWARLILDIGGRAAPFPRPGGIYYPLVETVHPAEMFKGTLYHFLSVRSVAKIPHIYGHYMRRFHAETAFAMMSFLDG